MVVQILNSCANPSISAFPFSHRIYGSYVYCGLNGSVYGLDGFYMVSIAKSQSFHHHFAFAPKKMAAISTPASGFLHSFVETYVPTQLVT